MIDENVLRGILFAVIEMQKTHYASFSAALNELAALRETVRGLDPTFSEVIEQKRKEQELATREVVQQQIRLIDALEQKLKEIVISSARL